MNEHYLPPHTLSRDVKPAPSPTDDERQRARESTSLRDKLSIYEGAHDLATIRNTGRLSQKKLHDALAGLRLYELDDVVSALANLQQALDDLEDDPTNSDLVYATKQAIDQLDSVVDLEMFFAAIRTPEPREPV